MPSGANAKREREYRELKQRFEEEGRYQGRAEEVASRIVNKQRSKFGETKGAKQQAKEGKSPDRNLPIDGYQHMTIAQVMHKLSELSPSEIRKIRGYESKHKNRKGLMQQLDRWLAHH